MWAAFTFTTLIFLTITTCNWNLCVIISVSISLLVKTFYEFYWLLKSYLTWDEVFKNGPSEVCGGQPLIILDDMVCLGRPYHFKIFKGFLPQILLGRFLNTVSHFGDNKYFQRSWTDSFPIMTLNSMKSNQGEVCFNPFQPSVAFQIETTHLFCTGMVFIWNLALGC